MGRHRPERAGAARSGRPPRQPPRRSANGETRQALRRLLLHIDACDARVRRAFVAPFDELAHRLRPAFGHYLDPPIREIACPARYAELLRLVCTTAPVPDALHPSANPEVQADHGAKLARERRAAAPAHGSAVRNTKGAGRE